jgi:hypothetical protein
MLVMKKLCFSRALRRLPLMIAAGGAALTLHACTRAEAEPQADPAQVQAYLAQMEAEERLITGEAKPKQTQQRAIHNLVEGAAVRAPSEAAINRLEKVVATKL